MGTLLNAAMRARLLLCASTALSALSCALPSGGEAQEWTLDTSLSQQGVYSDNLLLDQDNEIDTFGSITTPGFVLSRESPTLDVSLDARFEFAEYFNHSDFSSQDQIVRLRSSKQFSQRSTFDVNGDFRRDTILESEDDETGQSVDEPVRYISWDVAPSWTYLLSPLDEVTIGGSYRENSYDSSEKTDYQYFGGTVDYSHRLSEIDRATAELRYFRYIPDRANDSPTDVVSVLFGYGYEPSDRLSLVGAAGVGYSMRDPDGSGGNEDGVGMRLKFDARYDLSDVTYTRFSLSHDSEPSSDGEQTTRNRASLGLNQKLTPMTTIGLNLDYVDSYDYLGTENDATSDERRSRYALVRPSLSWLLTEDLSLVAEYSFRYKVFENDSDPAVANSVFLTLKYELPTWGWSGY
jgi:hypothetical protein